MAASGVPWRVCLAVSWALCGLAAAGDAVGASAVAQRDRKDWDVTLLEHWLAAAERHVPGEVDSTLLEAAQWSTDDLRKLWVDTQILLLVVANPRRSTFDVVPMDRPPGARYGKPPEIRPRPRERAVLDDLATRAKTLGVNRLVKRAALLHTDVVTLASDVAASSSGATSTSAPVKMLVGDGGGLGIESVSTHWALARQLLTNVAPNPRTDAFVRDWYRATVALNQSTEWFDSIHLGHGLKVFVDDPVLLWLSGCQHEAFASPLFQAFKRSFAYQRVQPEIASAGDELDRAERLFRRALAVDPALVEARVRLGRVLGLKGARDEAIRELGVALQQPLDPTLEYYARLFLGAEQQLAGALQAARAQFRRAVTLAPGTRVPHLALSQIARELGDRDDMLANLERDLAPFAEGSAIDPWWMYRSAQGRRAGAWLDEVRRAWNRGAP